MSRSFEAPELCRRTNDLRPRLLRFRLNRPRRRYSDKGELSGETTWLPTARAAHFSRLRRSSAELYRRGQSDRSHLHIQNLNEKLQVGSLTKAATAGLPDWAQLNKADRAKWLRSPREHCRREESTPSASAGDSLSLRDLLYTALMASDNVAATALAEHVGAQLPNPQGLGPISNFVSHMNALARTLGMKRTLLNPSGTDSIEGALPYSTASDIARLTRYAYSEADFPFFVSQKNRVVHIFAAAWICPSSQKYERTP